MAKETYEVGPASVFGHEPGTTFEAELNPVQRGRLLQSGALRFIATGGEPALAEHDLPPEQLKELRALKRHDLDGVATEMGIEGAGELPNAEAVIEAIAALNGGSTEGDSHHG